MSELWSLLPYQTRWVEDESQLALCVKSRRTGISWSEACAAVMYTADGRGNWYYQSYDHDMTRGFIADCGDWARAINVVASEVEVEIVRDEDRDIQTFRIRMAGGKTITALTSMPRAWRSKGKPGDVASIDEAAHVDDLETTLEAVNAMLMWGGRVRIISTHYGRGAFYALAKDIEEGTKPGSLHTITLADAIAEGLFRRICEVTDRTWSAEAQVEWEASVRAVYGDRAAQELDCIPSEGSGHWLSWHLIRAAEHADAGKPEKYSGGLVFLGEDIARRRHMWCLSAFELVGDVLWLREMRCETDIPFSRMHAIRAEMIAKYRTLRASLDQTGMGESVVEAAQERHGENLIEGVQLSAPRKLAVATSLLEAFEDGRMRIPADDGLRVDLHSVRSEPGPSGAPRLVAEEAADGSHADRFWSFALAVASSSMPKPKFAYRPVRLNHRDRDDDEDLDGVPGRRVFANRGPRVWARRSTRKRPGRRRRRAS